MALGHQEVLSFGQDIRKVEAVALARLAAEVVGLVSSVCGVVRNVVVEQASFSLSLPRSQCLELVGALFPSRAKYK